jgi:hypothetical protein
MEFLCLFYYYFKLELKVYTIFIFNFVDKFFFTFLKRSERN